MYISQTLTNACRFPNRWGYIQIAKVYTTSRPVTDTGCPLLFLGPRVRRIPRTSQGSAHHLDKLVVHAGRQACCANWPRVVIHATEHVDALRRHELRHAVCVAHVIWCVGRVGPFLPAAVGLDATVAVAAHVILRFGRREWVPVL